MKHAQLSPGDILIGQQHTMMYVGLVGDSGGHAMVHALYQQGVILETMTPQARSWWGADVYRCDNQELARAAAVQARNWTLKHNDRLTAFAPKRTEASDRYVKADFDDRRTGVLAESTAFKEQNKLKASSAKAPPFEFDAFFRSVKWASRHDRTFSENRGTTCCAFIIACCHAAAISTRTKGTGEEKDVRLEKALSFLKSCRGDKKPVTEKDLIVKDKTGQTISPASLRSFSNPGMKADLKLSFDEVAKQTFEILGCEELSLAKVFTEALLVDAKYVHTDILEDARFNSNTGGWKNMGYLDGPSI